ncbi:precorrin-4 C(11)-methyltransferase [Candidatus Poribacteria bacterium]|nr:precorrin-4 C(11)-methyltransferase [Candidatus Poribacteria bacterium]
MNEPRTTIFFIGAGPGDPELLTLKAKKIIEKADIIIYAGSLVNKRVLKYAKKSAELHDSAKMSLDDVTRVIESAKSNVKIIARVHSGDSSIYGAIQEQMDWCDKKKIRYSVIPGVSSFQAAAAALKQEYTLPDISQTIILTRISGRTKVPNREDIEELSKINATMVIFLSVQEIEKVVEKLKAGYNDDTPVAVVEKASWHDERIIKGTLKDIVKKVKKIGIDRQALIIVGNVLKKKNYEKSKLYDKNFEHGFRRGTRVE